MALGKSQSLSIVVTESVPWLFKGLEEEDVGFIVLSTRASFKGRVGGFQIVKE